jgi:xanthine/uracil/vitamin C permease (AzgA family)
VLIIDSLSMALAGLFGVSALTTYSAARVAAGARTGLAAFVLCLLLQ